MLLLLSLVSPFPFEVDIILSEENVSLLSGFSKSLRKVSGDIGGSDDGEGDDVDVDDDVALNNSAGAVDEEEVLEGDRDDEDDDI